MTDHTTIPQLGNARPAAINFVGVDWGTSNFRLMVFDADGRGHAELTTADGVATLGPTGPMGLESYLRRCLTELGVPGSVPVVMCGMVGSSLGWREVPYVDCPVSLSDLSSSLSRVDADTESSVYIVPGVRSKTGSLDVMRGEEVQVFGWCESTSPQQQLNARLCLPGTHAKWVTLVNDKIQSVETALTGELYDLLSQQSVLVQGDQIWRDETFAEGVEAAQLGRGILHNLFSVRANVVAGSGLPSAAASYLSGLLIGAELREQMREQNADGSLHLIGDRQLVGRYAVAAKLLGVEATCWDGAEMVSTGLAALWNDKERRDKQGRAKNE
ncbi:MAG: 2-dehydro-3-deoxygalactonokinase [Candidatus Azotimanducaceae bacterium]|jgi:2-dehydro-3-deoxygalactonokinase